MAGRTVKYAGAEVDVPEVKPLKVLGFVALGIGVLWGVRKLTKKKIKLPTKNIGYEDPLLPAGTVSQWSPTPLAKELYAAMSGINITGREDAWKKLNNIVDPAKIRLVASEYNKIANMNKDPNNLVAAIRDEWVQPLFSVKDELLSKLEILGLA